MPGYVARILWSFVSLVLLLVLVFFLSRLTGDPATLFLPIDATPQMIAQLSTGVGEHECRKGGHDIGDGASGRDGPVRLPAYRSICWSILNADRDGEDKDYVKLSARVSHRDVSTSTYLRAECRSTRPMQSTKSFPRFECWKVRTQSQTRRRQISPCTLHACSVH